jgi:hypothetical protein
LYLNLVSGGGFFFFFFFFFFVKLGAEFGDERDGRDEENSERL